MADPKKILHIDDDEDDRMLLYATIQEMDADVKVMEAENGVEALSILKAAESANDLPCLIVMDLNMPFMDGRQTLKRIKEDPGLKELPLVVFTSGSNPDDRNFFESQGINMVVKPSDLQYLHRIVQAFLTACRLSPLLPVGLADRL